MSTTGFGVVETDGTRIKPLEFGGIRTSPGAVLSARLGKIFDEAEKLFTRYRPDVVAVEQLFFSSNVKSAMRVSEAKGVITLAAHKVGAEVFEYTPLEVKMAMVGGGRAGKEQVRFMVRSLLQLEEPISSTHASDALALALCHLHVHVLQKRLQTVLKGEARTETGK